MTGLLGAARRLLGVDALIGGLPAACRGLQTIRPLRSTSLVLLDATAVLLGVGLAVAGFTVVVVVSATVLRLIGFVLGDGEATSVDEPPEGGAAPPPDGTSPEPGNAAPPGAANTG